MFIFYNIFLSKRKNIAAWHFQMFRIKWLNNILKLSILGVANFLVISVSEVFGGLHGKATLVIRSIYITLGWG